MKDDFEEKVREKARDQARKEAENTEGTFKRFFNWTKSKLMFWK